MMKSLFFAVTAAGVLTSVCAGPVKFNPRGKIISVPDLAYAYKMKPLTDAAVELKKHIKLISGVELQIVTNTQKKSGVIFIASAPKSDSEKVVPGDSRWLIKKDNAWFYGSDVRGAVTDFLEEGLGVRWPWANNISYRRMNPLVVKNDRGRFVAPLAKHSLRRNRWDIAPDWLTRLRSGGTSNPHYGHAFVTWPKRFGESHPEWFAMRKDGKRLPVGAGEEIKSLKDCPQALAERMSMCFTNPDLVRAVVEDWKKKGAREWINCCDNDIYSDRLCHCEKCRSLGSQYVSEKTGKCIYNFTDRTVNFAKRVVELARKTRPDVKACIYAYNGTEYPPRCERIENGEIAVMIVPTRVSMDQIKKLFSGWIAAGVKEFGVRPNRHAYYRISALPMGNEKHFFDVWQYEYSIGAKWFDYDASLRVYPIEYFRDYVLLKAMQDPSKPFEHWEEHYMQAFGAAKEDVKAYFRYWREDVWEKRITPVHSELDKGFYIIRPLMNNLGKYYKASDFATAGAFLDRALQRKNLAPEDRARVEELKLCNEHGLLFFKAVTRKTQKDTKELCDFRLRHSIPAVMWEENYIHDITGAKKFLYENGRENEIPEYIRAKDIRIKKILEQQKRNKKK